MNYTPEFPAFAEERELERNRDAIQSWWGWFPVVWEYASVGTICPDHLDGSGRTYAYMEHFRIDSVDPEIFEVTGTIDHHTQYWENGAWTAPVPSHHNGLQIRLQFSDVGPIYRNGELLRKPTLRK